MQWMDTSVVIYISVLEGARLLTEIPAPPLFHGRLAKDEHVFQRNLDPCASALSVELREENAISDSGLRISGRLGMFEVLVVYGR